MLSVWHQVSLALSLAGVGCGCVVSIALIHKMSSNKALAFRGDKTASNRLILPCYMPVIYSMTILFGALFLYLTLLYCSSIVKESPDKDVVVLSISFCSTFLIIPYSASPLLLVVKSLSRGGFRKVLMILLPCCALQIAILLCVVFLKKLRKAIMLVLFLTSCLPSIVLAVGVLSKSLKSRIEIRSMSSRSSCEFLLAYSILVVCFGCMYATNIVLHIALTGLGAAVMISSLLFPFAVYRTLNADTKFWRGLGKHNKGGIASNDSEAAVSESINLRIASVQLQSVVSDLSLLMVDFADIETGVMIGNGATSTVYKAEYKGKNVAIKVLSPPEISEEDLLSIREETCINYIMSHPSIVKIVGICVRPPDIGILMEYCSKGTLKKSLQSNPGEWTTMRKLQAASDLASAVTHVHLKGYMHRDIKAENLFVTDKWKIKLGDFGESRPILKRKNSSVECRGDENEWIQRMTVLGTVAYMAPELVNAEAHYTEAIDVYAMGVTFWEIWTGEDPFAKENTFSLYQLIVQGSRPDIPSSCPRAFGEVIEDAWQTNAEKRPSSSLISQRLEGVAVDFLKSISSESVENERLKSSMCYETPENEENLYVHKEDHRISSPSPASRETSGNAATASVDAPFQYDDMINRDARKESFYSNPLTRLFRKSVN